MGIPVHEEFIWLRFVSNFPPGYEFIRNNLQGSKESLTRTVLENALWSRYNVQSGGKKGRTILDSALFVSGSRAGRGVGRVGGSGGTNMASWTEGVEVRGFHRRRITCNHCQKPGHIRPNCHERQYVKCRRWGHETVSCPSKVLTPKENGDKKKKDESAVMTVNQVSNYEVTAETKIDENDGGGTTCLLVLRLIKMFPRLGNCHQKLRPRDGLQTVDARN